MDGLCNGQLHGMDGNGCTDHPFPRHGYVDGGRGMDRQPGSPNQFLLGVAFDNTDYTVADSRSLIRKELTTLARAGAVPTDAAKRVTFPYISNNVPYDLHVTGDEIAKGFDTQLLELEGLLNTYLTGTAFAGHNSGLIWKWNDGTVLPALKKELGL